MEKIGLEEKNLMRRRTGKTDLIQLVPNHLKRVDKPSEEHIQRRDKLKNKMKNRLHKEMNKMDDSNNMQIGMRKTKKHDRTTEGLHPTDKHHINTEKEQKPQSNKPLKPIVKRNVEVEGDEE